MGEVASDFWSGNGEREAGRCGLGPDRKCSVWGWPLGFDRGYRYRQRNYFLQGSASGGRVEDHKLCARGCANRRERLLAGSGGSNEGVVPAKCALKAVSTEGRERVEWKES